MQEVSIMADRGFNIKGSLARLNIHLNLPSFMEGHSQLQPEDVQHGRSIASLHIHVERAIGGMKQYKILTNVLSTTVCAYFANLQPALVPISNNQETHTSDSSDSDMNVNVYVVCHDVNHGSSGNQFL